MLKNAALDAKIGVDTAENEPQKDGQKRLKKRQRVYISLITVKRKIISSLLALYLAIPIKKSFFLFFPLIHRLIKNITMGNTNYISEAIEVEVRSTQLETKAIMYYLPLPPQELLIQ